MYKEEEIKNLHEFTQRYYWLQNEIVKERIEHKMKKEDNKSYLNEMDQIWWDSDFNILDQIKNLPKHWWFQYMERDNTSELDIFHCAKYFVKQKPTIITDVGILKNKITTFKNEIKNGDAMFFFLLEKNIGNNGMMRQTNLSMEFITNREYNQLEDKYKFDRWSNNYPIFIEK